MLALAEQALGGGPRAVQQGEARGLGEVRQAQLEAGAGDWVESLDSSGRKHEHGQLQSHRNLSLPFFIRFRNLRSSVVLDMA